MDINIIYFNDDFLSFKIKNKINDYYYDKINDNKFNNLGNFRIK